MDVGIPPPLLCRMAWRRMGGPSQEHIYRPPFHSWRQTLFFGYFHTTHFGIFARRRIRTPWRHVGPHAYGYHPQFHRTYGDRFAQFVGPCAHYGHIGPPCGRFVVTYFCFALHPSFRRTSGLSQYAGGAPDSLQLQSQRKHISWQYLAGLWPQLGQHALHYA